MQITVTLTEAEASALQAEYERGRENGKIRLPLYDWAAREAVKKVSKATSQKGGWAVDATLRPIFAEQFKKQFGTA